MRQEDITNRELLEFIQENVAMKEDIDRDFRDVRQTLTKHGQQFVKVHKTLDEHGRQLEGLAGQLKKLTDDKPFTDRRISRVEFRTEKLLGQKIGQTDSEFENRFSADR